MNRILRMTLLSALVGGIAITAHADASGRSDSDTDSHSGTDRDSDTESYMVEAWYTSENRIPDGQWFKDHREGEYSLSKQADLELTDSPSSEGFTISVAPQTRYQQIDGIGYSLEESTIFNLSLMSDETRRRVLEKLFDRETGIGLNMMRICIGSSDFTARDFYTYDDTPNNEADPELALFSIRKDTDYRITETLREVHTLYPDVKFLGSPWSPPAWMKTSESLVGGRLQDEYLEVYARYLAKSVEAYEQLGIPMFAITIQNEPLFVPPDYPGSGLDAERAGEVSVMVHREFQARNLDTKVLGYDHNYDQAFNYMDELFQNEEARGAVSGTAVHGYSGGIEQLDLLHDKYPDKDIYMTERAWWGTAGMVKVASVLRHWSRSYMGWVTMLDSDLKPEQWTNTPGPSIVMQNADDREDFLLTSDYYMVGQFSRFIERGAYRIDSRVSRADSGIVEVCFINPDNSLIIVVINDTMEDRDIAVHIGGRGFSTRLPGKVVATFRVPLEV